MQEQEQNNIPAPPPGFEDAPTAPAGFSDPSAAPPGFQSVQPLSDQELQQQTSESTFHKINKNVHAAGEVALDAVTGAAKGAGRTVVDIDNMVRHGLNHLGAHYEDLDGPDAQGNDSKLKQILKPDENSAEMFGYGGETLAEFLMGDEALKGLTSADKFDKLGKIFKVLGSSPKLMAALKNGANVGKAMAELGPEEQAALKKSPILARLVSAGMDAIRGGVVQGAQTLVHTDKTGLAAVGEAAKEGGIMAGVSAPIGAAFGAAGGYLAKGREAADVVGKMGEAASRAPEEQTVANGLGDAISSEKDKIDSTLNDTTQAADQTRDTATSAAATEKDTARQAADDTLNAQRNAQPGTLRDMETSANDKLTDSTNTATDAFTKTTGDAHQGLVDSLSSISGTAMNPKELAESVNTAINHTEAQTHKIYEESINSILDRLDGAKEPVTGSAISQRAQELLREPMPEDHAAVALAKKGSGNNLNKDVRSLLESLASGQVAEEGAKKAGKAKAAAAAAAGATAEATVEAVGKPMSDWTADSLIKLRQEIRQWGSGYMRGDVNARALNRLLPAIDDTLSKLAEKSGDPEVVNQYGKLRSAYKQAREVLDSSTADKLNLQHPDQAMNDVGKYLLGGNNPSAKIATLRKAVGDGVMQDIAKSKIQQFQRMAATDPQKFLREWSKIGDDVKQDFFGRDLVSKVQQAADTFTSSKATAEEAHASALAAAKAENKTALSTARDIVRQSDSEARTAHGAAIDAVNTKYKDAVNAAQDVYDQAVKAAKDGHASASEPFSGTFMKNLSEGRINDSLLKGKVDVHDIQDIKQAIGESKWQDIGDGVFQRAIADASPKGRFDPGKMMEWWNGIKPDVRREMFGFDQAKYEAAISEVKDSASFQKLVKGGVLAASVAPIGGLLKIGPLAEMIGIAGGITSHGVIRKFVDWAANHPNMWKSIASASEVADSKMAGQAGRLIRYDAGRDTSNDGAQRNKMKDVISAASGALGGNQ